MMKSSIVKNSKHKECLQKIREAKKTKTTVIMSYKNTISGVWGKMACCSSKSYNAYKMLLEKFDEIDVSYSELFAL